MNDPQGGARAEERAGQQIDLTDCDREPIHIPGRVQAHGVLLVLAEPDLRIVQLSRNAPALLGAEPEELLGSALGVVLTAPHLDRLKKRLAEESPNGTPLHVLTGRVGKHDLLFDLIVHRNSGGVLILELEQSQAVEADARADSSFLVKVAISKLHGATSLREFCQIAAEQVRHVTGFDRVMIYRFQEDESGIVVAEVRRAEDVEPFLDLRYPASDIPQQARRLYLLNQLRLIPDVNQTPAEIIPVANPLTGEPLDMSQAVLRSVSPIHIEYLKNMGVTASMSVSLVKSGRLWGLIACHHYSPKYVPYEVRAACELLGQIFSLQLASKEAAEDAGYELRLATTIGRFVELMSKEAEFTDGLVKHESNLLSFVEATGAALCVAGQCTLLGETPTEREVRHLAAWLAEKIENDVFATDALPSLYAPAQEYKDVASGLLAVSVTRGARDYVMWFRPELIRTVKWGGDPHKAVTVEDGGARLSPRKSFAQWQETVRLKSLPWNRAEQDAALALRRAITEVMLSRAEQLARLNYELGRSNEELDAFAFIASHDLKEPLRGIHNYSQFLIEGYAGRLDADGQAKLHTLMKLTERMDGMIDSLMHYSRVGRLDLDLTEVNLNDVVGEVLELLRPRLDEREIGVTVLGPLPVATCDRVRVEEVYTNLLTNAIKYSDKAERRIEIGFVEMLNGDVVPEWAHLRDSRDLRTIFYVRDNGIGIRERHYDQIFQLFRRLHGRHQYGGGTGAGLTIVKKIVERHGGRVWVSSVYGEGTVFYFTLQG